MCYLFFVVIKCSDGDDMEKKKIIYLFSGVVISIFSLITIYQIHASRVEFEKDATNTLLGTVLSFKEDQLTVQDASNNIYTFPVNDAHIDLGNDLFIEYTGILDPTRPLQEVRVISYQEMPVSNDEDGIPLSFQDEGIFKDFYILANNQLKKMTLDEKIGQLLLVRYPSNEEEVNTLLHPIKVGGFVFYEKNFQNKSEDEVKKMISKLQDNADIPLLTAVDEEGGRVVRASSNPSLRDEKFKSSHELYEEGGLDAIRKDTILKSAFLSNLGLNVNLAPVVDVSLSEDDYMYERSLQKDTSLTSDYAKTVIQSGKGLGVSYVLKHFPGYGNNKDTHTESVMDERSLSDIQKNDLPPFLAGIEQGAEAVLVSHNTVVNIDEENPASLSSSVHNLLRNDLHFTGIIMTDDLAMGATSKIENVYQKALLAGNDILMISDYEEGFNAIKQAVTSKTISESLIDKLAFRVLAWKYYKGLMFEKHK